MKFINMEQNAELRKCMIIIKIINQKECVSESK